MKTRLLVFVLAIVGFSQKGFGQLVFESENATLSGGPVVSTYKSTACVEMRDNGSIIHNFNIAQKGYYKFELTVATPSGYKEQGLYINNSYFSKLKMNANANFFNIDMGAIFLNQGANKIEIRSEWGWAVFDKIILTLTPPVDYTKTAASLINPNADTKTKELYQYLRLQYGKNILSGQIDFWDTLTFIARKQAKVRAFDFQHYSQGYAYLWRNGAHSFGWEDDGTTKAAIDWYNSTKGQGIVSFQWHWHPPMNSLPGRNTFMTNQTSFDVSRAVLQGTQEYTEIMEDIDSIASQLKKLQRAGVPVLWRPLHEAAGNGNVDGSQAWFWWGAKGATVCKQLWDIMYNRLTNFHKLNNLIWIWSTPEEGWYLGNAKLDMFGYDSYPNPIHHNSQKAIFSQMYNICKGEKLVAMTENGPIPEIDKCIQDDAMWSYFLTWNEELTKQNNRSFIASVYQHSRVIAIENTNFWEFNGSKEGWTSSNNLTTTATSSQLLGTVTAADPQVFSADNLMLPAQAHNWVIVAMQNSTNSSTAEFFWTTQTSPNFDATKKVTFAITPNDTKIRHYIVELSGNASWTGEIKRLRLDPSIAASGSVKIEFIKLTTPYNTLLQIPGNIEFENFNKGGAGNAYDDLDFMNNGAAYRTKEGVDIETCSEGGYNVGWTAKGEWLEYLVNVSKAGFYDVVFRLASAMNGNSFHLELDGETILPTTTVNTLGGLQQFFDVKAVANLPQGKHVLKFVVDNATGGFNLNKMTFAQALTTNLQENTFHENISVFPNPAQDLLTIRLDMVRSTQLEIINLLGEVVYTSPVSGNEHTLSVSDFATGVYVLKIDGKSHKIMVGR